MNQGALPPWGPYGACCLLQCIFVDEIHNTCKNITLDSLHIRHYYGYVH